jgi:hypothetical protein
VSEYKITVQSSRWQYRFIKAFLLLCLLSIWLWPQMASWQWIIQILLSVALLHQIVSGGFTEQIEHELVLADEGNVQLLVNGELDPFKMSASSVTSDWFCYLVLAPDGFLQGQGKRRIWVFRDGVDVVSFRRLCRVVHRLRRGSTE